MGGSKEGVGGEGGDCVPILLCGFIFLSPSLSVSLSAFFLSVSHPPSYLSLSLSSFYMNTKY